MVQKEQNERNGTSGLIKKIFLAGAVPIFMTACESSSLNKNYVDHFLNGFKTQEKTPVVIDSLKKTAYTYAPGIINAFPESTTVPFEQLTREIGVSYEPKIFGTPVEFVGGVYFGKADGRLRQAIESAGGDFNKDNKLTQSEWLYTAMSVLGAGFHNDYDRKNPKTIPKISYNGRILDTGIAFEKISENIAVSEMINHYVTRNYDAHTPSHETGKRTVAYDLNMLLGLAITGGVDFGGAGGAGATGAAGTGAGAGAGQSGRGGGSGAGAK